MRDDQVRRYARHILLADLGGVGQRALLAARARLTARAPEAAEATWIAARYLIAGGVGELVIDGGSSQELAALAAYGSDTTVVPADTAATAVVIPGRPAWWPGADGDEVAQAWWAGGLGATRWMADVANR